MLHTFFTITVKLVTQTPTTTITLERGEYNFNRMEQELEKCSEPNNHVT
jgi:hypothetical protein